MPGYLALQSHKPLPWRHSPAYLSPAGVLCPCSPTLAHRGKSSPYITTKPVVRPLAVLLAGRRDRSRCVVRPLRSAPGCSFRPTVVRRLEHDDARIPTGDPASKPMCSARSPTPSRGQTIGLARAFAFGAHRWIACGLATHSTRRCDGNGPQSSGACASTSLARWYCTH
jgi:hypothetical protein